MWGLVAASDVWMEIEMMSLRNNFKTSWTLQTWGLDFQNYAVLDKFCFFGVGDLSKLQHLRAVRMAGLWRPALDWRMWTLWSCFSFQTICRIGQGADLVIKYENDSPGPILSYHTASSVPESGERSLTILCVVSGHTMLCCVLPRVGTNPHALCKLLTSNGLRRTKQTV